MQGTLTLAFPNFQMPDSAPLCSFNVFLDMILYTLQDETDV